MPMKWNEMFNLLEDRKNLDLPLILNGWEMSSPLEKNLRFEDHVKSAEDHDQLKLIGEYLRALSEEDWAHYGEI